MVYDRSNTGISSSFQEVLFLVISFYDTLLSWVIYNETEGFTIFTIMKYIGYWVVYNLISTAKLG